MVTFLFCVTREYMIISCYVLQCVENNVYSPW